MSTWCAKLMRQHLSTNLHMQRQRGGPGMPEHHLIANVLGASLCGIVGLVDGRTPLLITSGWGSERGEVPRKVERATIYIGRNMRERAQGRQAIQQILRRVLLPHFDNHKHYTKTVSHSTHLCDILWLCWQLYIQNLCCLIHGHARCPHRRSRLCSIGSRICHTTLLSETVWHRTSIHQC
jgi:hypothetical protein